MAANDRQVAGGHYSGSAYQHWDYMADIRAGYHEGCATKYLARWRKKNGLQDLEKSAHFLEKQIEIAHQCGIRQTTHDAMLLNRFVWANGIPAKEGELIQLILFANRVDDLQAALRGVRELIEQNAGAEPGRGYVAQ